MTSRALFSAAEEYFQVYGAEFVGKDAPRTERVSEWDALGHEIVSVYSSYDTTDPVFDTSNLREFAGDIPCPEIDQAALLRYFQYGDADRWGKRREPRVEIPAEVEAGVLRWLDEQEHGSRVQIGLDVTGPGGSQWTAQRRSTGGWRLEPGLPATETENIALAARDMVELASQPLPTPAAKAAALEKAGSHRSMADRA